jgi:hypothetical protein
METACPQAVENELPVPQTAWGQAVSIYTKSRFAKSGTSASFT